MMVRLFVLVLILGNGWWQASPAGAQDARAQDARTGVGRIVRLLGYGGGIHHFKNYVLRGEARYRELATARLTEVTSELERLRTSAELDEGDREAIADLVATVRAYQDALSVVTRMYAAQAPITDIDVEVRIDDDPAARALDRLRAKFTWTDFEHLEFEMGYGQAIHRFKNLILRSDPALATAALQDLVEAEFYANRLLNQPQVLDPQSAAEDLVQSDDTLTDDDRPLAARHFREQRAALEAIHRTIAFYRVNLDLAVRLHALRLEPIQIDRAIKISDDAAVAALAHMRTLELMGFGR